MGLVEVAAGIVKSMIEAGGFTRSEFEEISEYVDAVCDAYSKIYETLRK
jgi:hypothetical protein